MLLSQSWRIQEKSRRLLLFSRIFVTYRTIFKERAAFSGSSSSCIYVLVTGSRGQIVVVVAVSFLQKTRWGGSLRSSPLSSYLHRVHSCCFTIFASHPLGGVLEFNGRAEVTAPNVDDPDAMPMRLSQTNGLTSSGASWIENADRACLPVLQPNSHLLNGLVKNL